MFHRLLNISESHSFFLLGPRGTGKSWLIKDRLKEQSPLLIDLLDPELFHSLSSHPNRLKAELLAHQGKGGGDRPWVIIDEIQKVPSLLDIVQQELSNKTFHFALTGSSARKLKRGMANLLAGRAFVYHLYPLSYQELGADFDIEATLAFGSLPEIFSFQEDEDKKRFLKAYAQTYLKEEIITEQIIRKLPPFRRFLEVAAIPGNETIQLTNVAKDIMSNPNTVSSYYEILEDTLLGFTLPSYDTSVRKRQKKSSRFYFFDTGVQRALSGNLDVRLLPKSFEYGQLFETYIINEIRKLVSYRERDVRFSFLRIEDRLEIDLIIEVANQVRFLVEIKSSDNVDDRLAAHLNHFSKDFPKAEKILLSRDVRAKNFGVAQARHWQEGVEYILGRICSD